ncbi:SEC-C metal-binding domain-containing protein [Prosthecochloris sp. HL-130-GSB]|uniref:SEC-C metal-binding domain-containing protein n=1 Tax=Prosthecochloris sp. HL-130-GSB TaxID=1974213 RepID=UPI0018DD0B1E
MRSYYEDQNREWNFFETPQLEQYNEHITQFVPVPTATATAVPNWTGSKVGRNEPCPCGSGKKFKKCHAA